MMFIWGKYNRVRTLGVFDVQNPEIHNKLKKSIALNK